VEEDTSPKSDGSSLVVKKYTYPSPRAELHTIERSHSQAALCAKLISETLMEMDGHRITGVDSDKKRELLPEELTVSLLKLIAKL
jgi:hypothetical protein